MSDNNDNLVDFTLIKLKKLRSEYLQLRMFDTVAVIEYAIDLYEQGKAKIEWRKGNPYLVDVVEDS